MPSLKTEDVAKSIADSGKHCAYQPYLVEYSLWAEYRLLHVQQLPGVYVVPSANSHLVWFGVLFIRAGMYEGGTFKFTIFIPENYPDADCPRLVFDVPVYHPMIDPISGELDCRRAFPKWRRNVNHIWQLVLYARRVFYRLETSPNPSNPEAAVLYEENDDLFIGKVKANVELCRDRLYEKPKLEDDHAIRFTELDQTVFNETKNKMLRPQRTTPDRKGAPLDGLSWMEPGSSHLFLNDELQQAPTV